MYKILTMKFGKLWMWINLPLFVFKQAEEGKGEEEEEEEEEGNGSLWEGERIDRLECVWPQTFGESWPEVAKEELGPRNQWVSNEDGLLVLFGLGRLRPTLRCVGGGVLSICRSILKANRGKQTFLASLRAPDCFYLSSIDLIKI
jgi:hypothetical protein